MKQSKLKTELVESLKLPRDLMLGTAILTVNGQNDAYIENYKGIIEYSQEKIKLQTKTCQITLLGSGLLIDYYTNEEMKISGHITEIKYQA